MLVMLEMRWSTLRKAGGVLKRTAQHPHRLPICMSPRLGGVSLSARWEEGDSFLRDSDKVICSLVACTQQAPNHGPQGGACKEGKWLLSQAPRRLKPFWLGSKCQPSSRRFPKRKHPFISQRFGC